MTLLSKLKFFFIRFKNTYGRFSYINRGKNSKYSCIVLTGHKPELWDKVFYRLKKYTPENIDILLITAGGKVNEISNLCKENNWSYLSVKRNNVCLAQNIAIRCLKSSEFIFKLDEDMFITKNFYSQMIKTYDYVQEKGEVDGGFVAPLIPINGYGYRRVLEKFNALNEFENKFGYSKITGGSADPNDFTKDLRIPNFFWKDCTVSSDIDKLDNLLGQNKFEYSICPIRFSIGAILFRRKLIEDMNFLKVTRGNGVSIDEIELCKYCNQHSLGIVVSENTAVGHLCYGPQTDAIIDYFNNNQDKF